MDSLPQKDFPQSLEAERALLGGLLLDHGQVESISETLTPEDFYSKAHSRIFELMLKASSAQQPLDVLGLADHIMASGEAEAFGGLAYATSLPEQVPSTDNLGYYAGLVKDKAVRRNLMQVATEINQKCYGGSDELAELLDFAERTVFQVAQHRKKQDWSALGQVLDLEWVKLEQRAEQKGDITGIPTGFADLDKWTAGLQRTDLIVLAARPAMGKTAFALNIAQRVGKQGLGVAVFSLEMAAGQLAMRILGSEARVDATKMRTGNLSKTTDWPALEDASERLYNVPLYIEDTGSLTITQLRSKARRLASKHDLGLIVIDYIQLMSGSGKNDNREQVIAQISRGLKQLAKELDVPILALSQLNRGVESRTNKRPMISDLRESGAIEQDADIILFIYRDEYYNPETTTEPGVAEIIVAKHRAGPTGTIKLSFQGQFTSFENLYKGEDPESGDYA